LGWLTIVAAAVMESAPLDALRYLDLAKCHNEGTRGMRDAMLNLNCRFRNSSKRASMEGHLPSTP
jgi:hypothetical protein